MDRGKPSEHMMTIETVATGLKVTPADVIEWVDQGLLESEVDADGVRQVPLEAYQRFGKSMPPVLMEKVTKYLWEGIRSSFPKVQNEVRQRYLVSNGLILDRANKAIELLERIHKQYEPRIELLESKSAGIASFIVFARVISILHSVQKLLRSSIPSETIILFRPLWEAIQLAKYFYVSHAASENDEVVRSWFVDDQLVPARDVRAYLSRKMGYDIKLLRELQNTYSKPLHHTFRSIMESYRGHSMVGFGKKHVERLGFDYSESSQGSDIVEITRGFESILLSALLTFKISLGPMLPMQEDDLIELNCEILFYELPDLERMQKTFSRGTEKSDTHNP